ncbi:hypothetical protein OAU93_03010 [bacterium]|jgi:hypothetical protein|nr:hypothetical protein [bacterium]
MDDRLFRLGYPRRYAASRMTYFHLTSSSALPDICSSRPFRAVVIVEDTVGADRQSEISKWLVESGCLYMMAWGNDCGSWDDSVDIANLEEFDYAEIPDDRLVMTTWHSEETIAEVFWFCKNCAFHPTVDISNDMILHLSPEPCSRKLTDDYIAA